MEAITQVLSLPHTQYLHVIVKTVQKQMTLKVSVKEN